MSEFDKLMDRAGTFPYRKYGKIRVAFKQKLSKDRVEKVINAVLHHSDKSKWKFPDNETLKLWKEKNYLSEYVCDDPPPKGFDGEKISGQWILDYVDRFSFKLVLDGDKMKGEPYYGHDMKIIKEHLPKWFKELTIAKADDILRALKGIGT